MDARKERKRLKLEQVDSFIRECEKLTIKSQRLAQFLKFLNILFNTIIIIGSVSVTFDGFFDSTSVYVRIIFGIVMGSVQTISSAFSLEKRGSVYKMVSIKYRKLARKISQLRQFNASEMDINNTMTQAYNEFDDLDITMYSNDNVLDIKHTPAEHAESV
jgi:hypothetical protein